jgi:hypothetical protein
MISFLKMLIFPREKLWFQFWNHHFSLGKSEDSVNDTLGAPKTTCEILLNLNSLLKLPLSPICFYSSFVIPAFFFTFNVHIVTFLILNPQFFFCSQFWIPKHSSEWQTPNHVFHFIIPMLQVPGSHVPSYMFWILMFQFLLLIYEWWIPQERFRVPRCRWMLISLEDNGTP